MGKIFQKALPKLNVIKTENLREKKIAIENESKKLLQALDTVVMQAKQQGLIKSSIKPQVLSKILGGASQLLVYDLFMQFSQGEVSATISKMSGMR